MKLVLTSFGIANRVASPTRVEELHDLINLQSRLRHEQHFHVIPGNHDAYVQMNYIEGGRL